MYVIGLTGPSGAGKTTALRVLEELGGRVFDCDAIYHELLRTDGELLGRIEAAFPGVVQDYTLDRKALGARVFSDPAALEKLTAITQPLVAKRVLEEIRSSDTPSSERVTGRQIAGAPGFSACHPEQSEGSVPPAPGGKFIPWRTGVRRYAEYPAAHPGRSEGFVPPSPSTPLKQPAGQQIAGATRFAVIDAIGLFESRLGETCDLTVAVIADPEIRVRRLMARDGISEAYARARIAAQKPVDFYTGQADLVLENNGTTAEFEASCRRALRPRVCRS